MTLKDQQLLVGMDALGAHRAGLDDGMGLLMLTLPADVARCRGRVWPEGTFLAPECQECKRWVAHYCAEASDGPVANTEPPTERDCPLRLPVDDGKTPNVRAKAATTAAQEYANGTK